MTSVNTNITLGALLEQVCRKKFGCPPTRVNTDTSDGRHRIHFSVGGRWTGETTSRNRKTAQHLAAKEVLLKIVDSGYYSDFGIPGNNKAEARDYINSLQKDLSNDETMASENWPNQCDIICQQRKLPRKPDYSYTEYTSGNDRRFVCKATLLKLEVTEEGASKKKAKAMAAKSMYQKIEEAYKNEPYGKDVIETVLASSSIKKVRKDSHNDLEEEEMTSESSPSTFKSWLEKKLKDWKELTHLTHEDCPGAEDLFKNISQATKNDPQVILQKIWPNFKYRFFLDVSSMVKLSEDGSDSEKIQEKLSQQANDTGEYTVFLEISDDASNKCLNFFAGTGSDLIKARSLACCAALMYLRNYINTLSVPNKAQKETAQTLGGILNQDVAPLKSCDV